MTTFDELVHGLFADLFRASPVFATALGNHDHDGAWPDQTEAGSRTLVALIDRWSAAFAALPGDSLTADEAIDRDIVLGELAAMRFTETGIRAEAWDPLAWVYLLGEGIHLLLAREFAPLGVRLASAADRIEGMPAVLDAARTRLVGVPGRPVSRLHAEVALTQLPGIGELCREALAAAAGADEEGELAPVRARLEPAVAVAAAALDAFATHLREVVIPAAEGEGRLGPDLFAAKLRHTVQVDMTADQLEARARREFDAVRAEMVRLARGLWPSLRPGSRCRRTTARSSAAPSTRSPPSIGAPRSSSTSVARSWREWKRSAASATWSASWTSHSRSSGPRSSCEPSAARCSARRDPWTAGSAATST